MRFKQRLLLFLLAIFVALPAPANAFDKGVLAACMRIMEKIDGHVGSMVRRSQDVLAGRTYLEPMNLNQRPVETLSDVLTQQINRAHFEEHGLTGKEKIFWIQQENIKNLNERDWDINGTEFLLFHQDRILAEIFTQHPTWGRVLHTDFKNRVVVSELSSKDFNTKVMPELKARLVAALKPHKAQLNSHTTWESFFNDNLKVGEGRSPETAHLQLKLDRLGLSQKEWRQKVSDSRKTLKEKINELKLEDISFEELLRHSRKMREDPSAYADWLIERSHGAVSKDDGIRLALNLGDYRDLLTVGDFIPWPEPPTADQLRRYMLLLSQIKDAKKNASPDQYVNALKYDLRHNWRLSRYAFYTQAAQAKHLIALDLQGVGARGLLQVDGWVERGAPANELGGLLKHVSEHIDDSYAKLEADIEKIVGKDPILGTFVTGDDGLIALDSLTLEQQKKIKALLADSTSFYSTFGAVRGRGLPHERLFDSIQRARLNVK